MSRFNRIIDSAPKIGPGASNRNTQRQPNVSASAAVSWIETTVRAKPAPFWIVNAVAQAAESRWLEIGWPLLRRLAAPAWRVAPTFVYVYDVEWIEHPAARK